MLQPNSNNFRSHTSLHYKCKAKHLTVPLTVEISAPFAARLYFFALELDIPTLRAVELSRDR